MNPVDQGSEKNGKIEIISVADELKQESERLRLLAEKLKAREEALAEMERQYPYFKAFVYAKLREEFADTIGDLPDKDLETIAQEDGALPLEAFIHELEQTAEGD